MEVIKRSGKCELVFFDKIIVCIKKFNYGLVKQVDYIEIVKKVILGLYDGVIIIELDNLVVEMVVSMVMDYLDYVILVVWIVVFNLYKNINKLFSKMMKVLYEYIDLKMGEFVGLISKEVFDIMWKYCDEFDSVIIYDCDYEFDFFGFKILECFYLMCVNGNVVECLQYMLMCVVVGIYGIDIESVLEMYNLMFQKWFIYVIFIFFNVVILCF